MASPGGSGGGSGLAWAALLASLAAVAVALSAGRRREPVEDDRDLADPVSMENRLRDAEQRLESAEKRISGLEQRAERAGTPAPPAPPDDGAPVLGVVREGGEAPLPADPEARAKEKGFVLEAIRKATWSLETIPSLMARARLLGAHDEAILEMEKYAKENETHAEAYVALGIAYGEAIRSATPGPAREEWAAKAARAFALALMIERKNKDAHVGIAAAWKAAGDVAKAREALERALTVLPGDKDLQAMLEGLR